MLTEKLSLLMQQAFGSGLVGLLFIDLGSFKTINDTFGHSMGDLLLMQVALRPRARVRQSDMVARQGGDEFMVISSTTPLVPVPGYFVHWSTQSFTVLYQSREFCGFRTQWPSSGK